MTDTQRSLDAFAAIDRVARETTRFLRTHFGVEHEGPLARALEAWALAPGGLLSDPLVEAALPLREDATLAELAEEGVLHTKTVALLDASGSFPRSRRLWVHQAEALRAAAAARRQGRAGVIVVAAGTGTGKTECFTIPILDGLVRDAERGPLRPGVRTIIVYPLNALVMDQLGRWRQALHLQERVLGGHAVRIGLYTSRLPETAHDARRLAEERAAFLATLPEAERVRATPLDRRAEIHDREQLRREPPHVLITNYTMLEYALVRPKDDPIFALSEGLLENLVLDEAHTYRAGMAAELALLLRRIMLRFSVSPRAVAGYATSATFGEAGAAQLGRFAADLFGHAPEEVSVVVARHQRPAEWLPPPARRVSATWTEATVERAHAALSAWDGSVERRQALEEALRGLDLLHDAATLETLPELVTSHELAALTSALAARGGTVALETLAETIALPAGIDRRRAASLLARLAAFARATTGGRALLPLRVHAVLQGAGAINACVNRACPARPADPHPLAEGLGHLAFARRVACEHCGSPVLHVARCTRCGARALAGVAHLDVDTDSERLVRAEPPARAPGARTVLLCPAAKELSLAPGWRAGRTLSARPTGALEPGPAFRELLPEEEGNDPLRSGCPCCGEPGFGLARAAVETLRLSVIEGLFEAIPAADPALPGGGRRLLSFSDGRQAAARLAPHFAFTHGVLLFRAALAHLLALTAPSETERSTRLLLDKARAEGKHALVQALEAELASSVPETLRVRAMQMPERLLEAFPGLAIQVLACDDREPDPLRGDARRLLAVHVSRELSRAPVGQNSAETLGLAELCYPGLDALCDAELEPLAARTGLTTAQTRELLAVLLDTLRRQGAVQPLPEVDPREPDFGGAVLGKWAPREAPAGAARDHEADDDEEAAWTDDETRPFIPRNLGTSARASLVRRLLSGKGFASGDDDVRAVLRAAFDLLATVARRTAPGVNIQSHRGSDELQVRLADCEVRRASALYRCVRCGVTTTRTLGICPRAGCAGALVPAPCPAGSAREELGHYARKAVEMELVGPRCVEHTAQLEAEALELLETKFRQGRVNLLSSSTTLELGIDIGELGTVLLNNLPPSPSSYVQRAGRAGRRGAGTSLALTLAHGDPADLWAFGDLRAFLERRQPPPRVHLETERIARRHLNAWLLGRFFAAAGLRRTGGPLHAWGKVGSFFLEEMSAHVRALEIPGAAGLGPAATPADLCVGWLDAMAPSPEAEMLDELARLAAGTAFSDPARSLLGRIARELADALRRIGGEVRARLDHLEEEKAAALGDDRDRYARHLDHRLHELRGDELVGLLAREGVLPSYGFPIDVMQLDIRNPLRAEDGARAERYRMERTGSLAIREYAPGNELVVEGFLFTVAGLSQVNRKTLKEQRPTIMGLAACLACARVERLAADGALPERCPRCGSASLVKKDVVVPQGFATDPFVRPGRAGRRPERPRGTAFFQDVGTAPVAEPWVEVTPRIRSRYLRTVSLFALGRGLSDEGFDLCLTCGRAAPAHPLRPPAAHHDRLLTRRSRLRRPPRCSGRLQRTWIGYRYQTDGLELCLAGALPSPTSLDRGRPLPSVAQALRLAAARLLEVDVRELEQIAWSTEGESTIVLFDQRPGGSGYMPLLSGAAEGRRLVEEALAIASHAGVPERQTARCTRACPACLLTMDSRAYAESLDREFVIEVLSGGEP